MSNLSIRSFDLKDEPAVVSLWKKCGLIVPQNDPSKDITRKVEVGAEWFLVGEKNGTIITTCMIGYDGHRGCVNYLAVDPEHQSRGYGQSMMKKAEEILLEVGCPKINLLVRSSNTQVASFYETLGYSDNECLSLGKRLIPDQ